MSIRRILLFLGLLIQLPAAQAQLEILSIEPANLSMDNAVDAAVTITFNQAIDPSIVDYTHFKTFGRWSGPTELSFSVSDDGKVVKLDPFDGYFAGEQISIMLKRDIRSITGDTLSYAYCSQFWIKPEKGNLEQELITTIPLRQNGETFIQSYGAYAGDLNNDGSSDLTVVNENSDDLRILLNDGMGQYSISETIEMGNAAPSPNEAADFDGDGEIDLAVGTVRENEMRVLFGDGEGSLGEMDTYTGGEFVRGLAILDINTDGYYDILTANRGSSDCSLFINDGFGEFTTQTEDFDGLGFGETALASADVNNDGKLDAFIGYYDSREIGILMSDEQELLKLTAKVSVIGQPWMLAAGDLNADGFADVVSANSSGDRVAVCFGDGIGGLSAATYYSYADSGFPLAIDLGDLDGDGDLDMVSSNYSSANFIVFENDGSGVFSRAATLDSPVNASCSILHDRDNDGDLDISATDEGADVVLLFENGLTNSLEELYANSNHFQLSPNPVQDQLTVGFTLAKSEQVKLSLYSPNGQLIRTLEQRKLSAGQHQLNFNTKTLSVPTGLYFIALETLENRWLRKIVLAD